MTPQLCRAGVAEPLKAAVHGTATLIAAVMAGYNIAAWCYRWEGHLGVNAVVYTLAVGWEIKQTLRHVRP